MTSAGASCSFRRTFTPSGRTYLLCNVVTPLLRRSADTAVSLWVELNIFLDVQVQLQVPASGVVTLTAYVVEAHKNAWYGPITKTVALQAAPGAQNCCV